MDIDLDLPVSRVSWKDKLIAPAFESLILILRRILEILLYVYKQKERSLGLLDCVNVFFLQVETTVKVNRMVEMVQVFLDLVLASACVPFFLSFSVFFSFFFWLFFFFAYGFPNIRPNLSCCKRSRLVTRGIWCPYVLHTKSIGSIKLSTST